MDYSDFFKQNRGNLWARRWWSVLPLVFIQICSSAFADPLYLDTVLGSERLLKADFNLPLQTQIANGFVLANKAIDSGAALSVVKKWAQLTNEIVSAR